MLARAGDRGETFAAELRRPAGESQQGVGGGHFGFLVRLGAATDSQCRKRQTADRVAEMGRASTLLLDVVFAGLRQQARVAAGATVAPALASCCANQTGDPAGSTRTVFPVNSASAGQQRGAVRDRDRIAQPAPGFGRQFGGIDEQVGRAVRVHQGEAQGERRERHVAAADVQQPGDRGRIGQHRRVLLGVPQQLRYVGPLVFRRPARICQRMRLGGRSWRRRPIGPDRIDRIGVRPAPSVRPASV